MNYFIQRCTDGSTPEKWRSEKGPFFSVEEAKHHAVDMKLESNLPEALRIVDENEQVCGWVSRNGHKPGGALPPNLETVQGKVFLSVFAPGSKSEREAHVLNMDDGTELVLRLNGGNAMFDPDLDPLINHKVKLIGYRHGYTFIVDLFFILE
jgi:hypothetical protein